MQLYISITCFVILCHDKEGSIDRLKAAGPEVCMPSKIEIKTH